ncbi:hypothetical protein CPC08DRAFT_765085 [Agrocybe pediades]|nr:hypothetical protein CPC08DRAFT_765085 [Agrocybe pediades]
MSKPQDSMDKKKVFKPPNFTIKDINSRIPPHLHEPSTSLSLLYFARDVAFVALFWTLATKIDPMFRLAVESGMLSPWAAMLGKWASWCIFWFFQSVTMTGLWVLGHECGHRAFSRSRFVSDCVGYLVHTFTGTPYFSWKITHHIHHSFHGSLEKDSHHIPRTRSELGIPPETPGQPIDYREYLEDTPIYTILMLMIHQFIGFPLYISTNLGGQRNLPSWTSHFNPNATALFKPDQKWAVLASNVGIMSVIAACYHYSKLYGWAAVSKYYIIPWLWVNNWIMVIVYLQHTDPRVPRYRSGAWTFTRGAACTIDRPLLGPLGRFFLHDVAHFHVAHHLFPRMPFYHTEEATKYIRAAMGEHYLSHEEYWLSNLWKSFGRCLFVEDEGDVVFFKDKDGEAVYELASE